MYSQATVGWDQTITPQPAPARPADQTITLSAPAPVRLQCHTNIITIKLNPGNYKIPVRRKNRKPNIEPDKKTNNC